MWMTHLRIYFCHSINKCCDLRDLKPNRFTCTAKKATYCCDCANTTENDGRHSSVHWIEFAAAATIYFN